MVGVKAYCLIKVGQRPVKVAQEIVRPAPAVISRSVRSVIGIEPNGLVEIRDGAVIVAFSPKCNAPSNINLGVFRFKPYDLVEIRDGTVIVAFIPIRKAPIVISQSEYI